MIKFSRFQPLLLPTAAGVCLAQALILAAFGNVAGAGITGVLFLILALLHFLPQLESFKALGVEAKLRREVDRAEEILARMRAAALASAKASYMYLAWGNRMASVPERLKRSMADEIDSMLDSLHVPNEHARDLKRDYIRFIAADLAQIFTSPLAHREKKWKSDIEREFQIRLEKLQPDQREEARREKDRKIARLVSCPRPRFREAFNGNLEEYLIHYLPNSDIGVPSNDLQILRDFAKELGSVYSECVREARMTDAALECIEKYEGDPQRGERRKYDELFGVD